MKLPGLPALPGLPGLPGLRRQPVYPTVIRGRFALVIRRVRASCGRRHNFKMSDIIQESKASCKAPFDRMYSRYNSTY